MIYLHFTYLTQSISYMDLINTENFKNTISLSHKASLFIVLLRNLPIVFTSPEYYVIDSNAAWGVWIIQYAASVYICGCKPFSI